MSKRKVQYKLNKNKYLAADEFAQLGVTLKKFEDKDFRNTTLLWLMVYTGARATEALNVEAIDLDSQNESVLIKGIKGSNDRELPLPSWLFQRLTKLAKETPHGALFEITYKRLYQIWDLYRPCLKSIKSLRHTYAVQLYDRSKDIRLVKHALGHRNITNTMIYADYQYSQVELRKDLLGREKIKKIGA